MVVEQPSLPISVKARLYKRRFTVNNVSLIAKGLRAIRLLANGKSYETHGRSACSCSRKHPPYNTPDFADDDAPVEPVRAKKAKTSKKSQKEARLMEVTSDSEEDAGHSMIQ